MNDKDIHAVMRLLEAEMAQFGLPPVSAMAAEAVVDPFKILVSTIISARTKDEVTGPATERLFALADSPENMQRLPEEKIEKAIFPAGFYRTKAKAIRKASREIVERFGSRVPDTIEELVTLPGVGRKTANLVVTLAHGRAGICVDTHVHRITNRWGYVATRTPEETEMALRERLPATSFTLHRLLGVTPEPGSPEATAETIRNDIVRWKQVANEANIHLKR